MAENSTQNRTHVTYLYPGSFLPEEGRTVRVADATLAWALRHSPDDRWFAAEFSTQDWQRWTNAEGDEKWMPVSGARPVKRRVYVGEAMTVDQVAALPGDHRTLISNMNGNGWATVVRTRAGNFQPVEDGDVVVSAADVEVSR